MSNNFTAPKMHTLENNQYLSGGQHCTLNKESDELLNALLVKLSALQYCGNNERWKFWVSVQRGEIEDFGDYDELHEDGDYNTYEEFERSWKEWFPKEEYWYQITVATHGGYSVVGINNSIIINISPNEKTAWGRDYSEFLKFLITEVDKMLMMIKEGTYEKHINTVLPYQYRKGIIPRKRLWEICSSAIKQDCGTLSKQEIEKFVAHSQNADGNEGGKSIGRLKKMTARLYYEICESCYTAAKFKDIKGLSARAMYDKYADNRNGGLTTIDESSADAFDAWYDLSDTEKWKIQNPSHMWEISMGHTHTMIHLFVRKDEDGYYFELSGGLHCRNVAVIRMYNALKAQGLPIYLYAHKLMAKMVMGDDDVGIVPCTDTPSQYWYGGFPQRDVLTFISTDDEDYTETEVSQIMQSATWFDIPTPTLKAK